MYGLEAIRKQADYWFSRLVRLRAVFDRGNVRCVTCDKVYQWDCPVMQAGHFRRRWHKTTRYDDNNVFPQCLDCNYYGNEKRLEEYMVSRYGQEMVDDLILRSNQVCSDRMDDYLGLIKAWKMELCERGDLQACEECMNDEGDV